MEAQARAAELEREIAGHKSAIRSRRFALARAAEELARLRAELAGLGVRLVVTEKGEGGARPWPSPSSTSTRS